MGKNELMVVLCRRPLTEGVCDYVPVMVPGREREGERQTEHSRERFCDFILLLVLLPPTQPHRNGKR